VFPLTNAFSLRRCLTPTLLALMLAVRLLSPAGFMPSFEHGSVAVVECPDSNDGGSASRSMHHHGGKRADHPPCPYAAAAGEAALDHGPAAPAAPSLQAPPILLGPGLVSIERKDLRERPPARAPPTPA